MTLAQITGLIRAVLAAIGGGLVAKGVVTADTLTQGIEQIVTIVGGVAWLVTAFWSWKSNHPSTLAHQLSVSKQDLSGQVAAATGNDKK
jgi:flagellar motor component MotA